MSPQLPAGARAELDPSLRRRERSARRAVRLTTPRARVTLVKYTPYALEAFE